MSEVKRYHLSGGPLVEGEALGRLNVVLAADFDRVQAENRALQERLTVQDQRVDDLRSVFKDLISAVRSINRSPQYEVRVVGDDEPQYRQRKEWVDWILELCDEATTAFNPTTEVVSHDA
ncbi:MAG: hypothetical protein K0S85_32 [Pseudomonas orientalis]|nr:hypothetical protein [Pseudomonas orientalis]